MDISFFQSLEVVYWYWFIFAGVVLITELAVGSAYLLWLALSAVVTGMLALFFPGLSLQTEILIWSILSLLSVLLWRSYSKKALTKKDKTTLNRRGQDYIGYVFTLENDMIDGRGRARIGGFYWVIKGPDLKAGTKVQVIDLDGAEFVVKEFIQPDA